MAEYHEAQLADLVAHVAEVSDRSRDGELNASDVDHVLFQYSRTAEELWTFCITGAVKLTARQGARRHRSTDASTERRGPDKTHG